jgi:hypothetical protein
MVHAMEGIAALAEVHTRLRAGITAAIQAAHAALDAGDYAEVKRLMSDAEYNQVLINHATDDGDGCPMFYLVSYAGRFQLAQHESRKRNKGVQ